MKIDYLLLVLMIDAFGIGTTGFSPMGLLPAIACGMDVLIPTTGVLIGAYAAGVIVSVPLMTLLLSHRARRSVLVFLMAIFTLDNILSTIAPGYMTLMFLHILTNLNHRAFFGLGSAAAASVVSKHKQVSTVVTMFMGLTLANIGSVPTAAWLSETIGWRISFLATAGLGVISMVGPFFSLPRGGVGVRSEVKKGLAVLMRPQVLSVLLTTILEASAMLTLYTYISSILQSITHATPVFVAAMLVLTGAGLFIGSYLGGKLVDHLVSGTLRDFLPLLMAIMLTISFPACSEFDAAINMVAWDAATFMVIPPLQVCVMCVTSETPGLFSSVNINAFNLGNALGAAAGGTVVSAGLGHSFVPTVGAVVAGLVLLLVFMPVRKQPETVYVASS